MTRSYIDAQEGKIVYITHRFPITEQKTKSKDGFGESGVRGIVQGGKCYKITIGSDYQNEPAIYVELIDERLVVDIKSIPESEQGILEKKLVEYYRSRVDKPQKPPGPISIDLLVCMREYKP